MVDPTRVLLAVPIASQALAGDTYAMITGNAADSYSFTTGFLGTHASQWAVGCWLVPGTSASSFNEVIADYPGTLSTTWADDPAVDPEAKLSIIGLTRTTALIAPGLE